MRQLALLFLPPSSREGKHWSSNYSKVGGFYRHNKVGGFDLERNKDNIPENVCLNRILLAYHEQGCWGKSV